MSSRTIQIKFDGSSDGFARAAKKAQRDLENWERSTGKIAGKMGKTGAAIGGSLFEGFLEGTKNFGSFFAKGGPLALVGLPAAAALGIALGGVISGAIVGGLSVGVIAGGIALAVRDPKIKSAFADLGDEMMEELTIAASSFHEPIMRSIQQIHSVFNSIDFRGLFTSASRYVEPLVNGMLGLARNVIPGIQRAIDRAAPVIDVISRNLPRIGTAISDAFDSMSRNAGDAAGALEWFFMGIEKIIRGGGAFIGFLTSMFSGLIRVNEVALNVADTLFGWLPILGDNIDSNRANIDRMKASMEQAKTAGDNWRGGTIQLTASQGLAAEAQQKLWNRTVALKGSMDQAVNAAGSLSQAFQLLNGDALNAREAESQYQAAIDAVTDSIRENGKTLDLNTAKGRANDQAIRSLIQSTDRKAQATYDEIAATKGSAAAQAAASRVYAEGRAQLVRNLTQILGNARAAEKLADEIMQIPKSWSTKVNLEGHQTAIDRARAIQRAVNSLTGKTIRIGVSGGPGGHLEHRWGGIDYAMARGGAIGAHFAKSPTVLYGERETGGEAFIPRKGNLARSRKIAETVVREWLNGDVVWDQARRSSSSSSSSGSGVTAGGNVVLNNYVEVDGNPMYAKARTITREELARDARRQKVGRW